VNFYWCYVCDFAAPINLEWGRDNRTTGIRIPLSGPESRRIENRLAGMDANPYLAIAASLAAGYLGLVEERRPEPQFKGDAYDSDQGIPRDIAAALDVLAGADAMKEILGPDFVHVYSAIKRSEHAEFLGVISPWEREHLLLNV
jgi:glutamine synthetase